MGEGQRAAVWRLTSAKILSRQQREGSGAVTGRRADSLVVEHRSANCTPVLHPWLEIGGEKRTTRRK